MSNPFRTRLCLESLDARITPSDVGFDDASPAFTGLDVAVERFYPTDPTLTASPVFALNYGTDVWTGDGLAGLDVAGTLVPPNPISPVFFGLDGGSVDTPA